jgi:hypothetical protein
LLARDPMYQNSIVIEDSEDTLAALTQLRSAGSALLRTLFFTNEAANPLAAALGRQFVDAMVAAPPESRVVIGIEGYSLPWHALYLEPTPEGEPSPDLFLGLRHVLSEVMTNVTPRYDGAVVQYRGKLSVALHFDARIDKQQGIPIVQHQLDFWQRARRQSRAITLHERHTIADVEQSLGPRSRHHVLYFVCHAGVKADARGRAIPGLAWLGLPAGDGQLSELTQRMLSESKQTTAELKTGPLVFINACESAQLSPEFYENFATYFLERGARALIGTECKIATFFADEFAQELFRAVLSGWPVGEAMLHVRKTMLAKGNALGLAYGLHGLADTQVAPDVLRVSGGEA